MQHSHCKSPFYKVLCCALSWFFILWQKTLDIPKEDQADYKYVGQSLVYDPEKPLSNEMEQTRLALPGNRGIFTHPSMRPRTVGNYTKGQSRSRYSTHGGSSVNLASTKVQSPRGNEVTNFEPLNSARECASQGGETSVTELNSAR